MPASAPPDSLFEGLDAILEVVGATVGAALGTSTVSNLGGAALGYAAQALAPASAALVGGVASATARP